MSPFRSVRPPAAALAAVVCFAAFAAAGPLAAQVTLTRIVDIGTAVPGGGGEAFDDLGEGDPVLSGLDVSFFGSYPSGSGIFRGDGTTIVTVADETTDDPDGSAETLNGYRDVTWLDGSWTTFLAAVLSDPGIFLSDGVSLATVAENGDPFPGGGSFSDFGTPSVEAGRVAFLGEADDGGIGVFLADGSLVTIADDTTPIPGSGGDTFADFDGPTVDGSQVGFVGRNFAAGRAGVYLGSGGPLTVVADVSDTPPGGSSPFNELSDASFDGGVAAFVGAGSGFSGIYLGSGGPLLTVVDSSTPRPGGGTFSTVRRLSLSDGNVLFRDADELFFWEAGAVTRLLGPGDLVDGKIVDGIFVGTGGLDGRRFVITLEFTDGSYGFYRGEVPVTADPLEVPVLGPGSLAILALLLAAAAAFVLRPTA